MIERSEIEKAMAEWMKTIPIPSEYSQMLQLESAFMAGAKTVYQIGRSRGLEGLDEAFGLKLYKNKIEPKPKCLE